VTAVTDVSRLPGPMEHEWQWQRLGSCRGMDSAMFFHPDGERNPSRARRTARAKQVCAHCPVIQSCREFALRTREPFGVWGGLAETERNAILEGNELLADGAARQNGALLEETAIKAALEDSRFEEAALEERRVLDELDDLNEREFEGSAVAS
jgi:WhiB family redox-sensing transcriptional regulator